MTPPSCSPGAGRTSNLSYTVSTFQALLGQDALSLHDDDDVAAPVPCLDRGNALQAMSPATMACHSIECHYGMAMLDVGADVSSFGLLVRDDSRLGTYMVVFFSLRMQIVMFQKSENPTCILPF